MSIWKLLFCLILLRNKQYYQINYCFIPSKVSNLVLLGFWKIVQAIHTLKTTRGTWRTRVYVVLIERLESGPNNQFGATYGATFPLDQPQGSCTNKNLSKIPKKQWNLINPLPPCPFQYHQIFGKPTCQLLQTYISTHTFFHSYNGKTTGMCHFNIFF